MSGTGEHPIDWERLERLFDELMALPAADRAAQEAAKEPPRYVGRCATLTSDERRAREAEGRRGALRFRVFRKKGDTWELGGELRGVVKIELK